MTFEACALWRFSPTPQNDSGDFIYLLVAPDLEYSPLERGGAFNSDFLVRGPAFAQTCRLVTTPLFRRHLIGWFSHYPFTTAVLHSCLTSGFVAPIMYVFGFEETENSYLS